MSSFKYKGRLCFVRASKSNNAWSLKELLEDEDVKKLIKTYNLKRTKDEICSKLKELDKEEKKKHNEINIEEDIVKIIEPIPIKKKVSKKKGVKVKNPNVAKPLEDYDKLIYQLNGLRVCDLKELLRKHKLPLSGIKQILFDRLKDYYEKKKVKQIKKYGPMPPLEDNVIIEEGAPLPGINFQPMGHVNFQRYEYQYMPISVKQQKISCINKETFVCFVPFDEVADEKFIKLSNGYGYDIDELVEAMISSKDQNVNPADTTSSTKIWIDEAEKESIFNHEGLDEKIKERYFIMLDEMIEEEKKIIGKISQESKLFDMIANTGFKCLNDHPSSYSEDPNVFLESQKAIEELRDSISKSPLSKYLGNMSSGHLKLKNIIDKAHAECIHGIGYKLLTVYASNFHKAKFHNKELQLSPYFIQFEDLPNEYITSMIVPKTVPASISYFALASVIPGDPVIKKIGKLHNCAYNASKDTKNFKPTYDIQTDQKYMNFMTKHRDEIVNHFIKFYN